MYDAKAKILDIKKTTHCFKIAIVAVLLFSVKESISQEQAIRSGSVLFNSSSLQSSPLGSV